MPARKNTALKALLTLLLIACAAAFAVSFQFYTEALVDAFFALALAGFVILHFRVRPDWRDIPLVLASTAIFAAVDFRVLHYPPKIMAWFSFLGLSSFLIVAVRAVWAEGEERKSLLYAWVPAVLFVVSEYFASDMLAWTAAAHPKTFDPFLLSFDCSLRVQWSFIAGQAFARWPWLLVSGTIAYVGLALPISLVYAGRLVRNQRKAFPAMLAFLITGPVGVLFYNLFPACGPRYLLGMNFPAHPFPLALARTLLPVLEPITIQGPRNAMPSLHMAWMLLAWWYSRGLSLWERAIVFAFLALTVVATLGTGEHWFADLIVAFPFALLIQATCAYTLSWKDVHRLTAFFFGLFVTLAWLVTLRFGAGFFWTSPVIPWALVAATVALTIIRMSDLNRAVDQAPEAADSSPAPLEAPLPEAPQQIN
jgi:hypothetical protein